MWVTAGHDVQVLWWSERNTQMSVYDNGSCCSLSDPDICHYLLPLGLALTVRVRWTLLAGLDEFFAFETFVASSPLPVLVSSGRLPLLLLLFTSRLLALPNGVMGEEEKNGDIFISIYSGFVRSWKKKRKTWEWVLLLSLTSLKRRMILRRSLYTLSLLCHTASSPLQPLCPTPEGTRSRKVRND